MQFTRYAIPLIFCGLLLIPGPSISAQENLLLAEITSANGLLQPDWPEPGCLDGETVEDPFCQDDGGGTEGGGGWLCQYCEFTSNFVFQCAEVDYGDTGKENCYTENGGADCYPSGSTCGKV